MFHKVERRLRDARVVEVLGNIALRLDNKADFQEQANLQPVFEALVKLGLESGDAHRRGAFLPRRGVPRFHQRRARRSACTLAAQPEYRRFRALARTIARYNDPPFVVVKEDHRESRSTWRELLDYVKTEGKKDAAVQRYKGLGEMNAEQLAETTMNPEKRTLLKVRLEDAVESEEIFSTLMGEDVESRRKFIEENALDVKNLDV